MQSILSLTFTVLQTCNIKNFAVQFSWIHNVTRCCSPELCFGMIIGALHAFIYTVCCLFVLLLTSSNPYSKNNHPMLTSIEQVTSQLTLLKHRVDHTSELPISCKQVCVNRL